MPNLNLDLIWKVVIVVVAVNGCGIGFCIYLAIKGREEIKQVFRNVWKK